MQQIGLQDGGVGKSPEVPPAGTVREIDRKAADEPDATLCQPHGSCQAEPAGVAHEDRGTLLHRVVEHVKPEQALIALARHHITHHAAGGDGQGNHTRIEQEQLACRCFKVGHRSLALVHQGGQRVVERHHALHITLQDLRVSLGQVQCALPRPHLPGIVHAPKDQRSQRHGGGEHQPLEHPGTPSVCASGQACDYLEIDHLRLMPVCPPSATPLQRN